MNGEAPSCIWELGSICLGVIGFFVLLWSWVVVLFASFFPGKLVYVVFVCVCLDEM